MESTAKKELHIAYYHDGGSLLHDIFRDGPTEPIRYHR